MLEASKPLTDVGRDGAIGAFASLAELTSFVRRQFPVVASIVALVLAVAIVYLLGPPRASQLKQRSSLIRIRCTFSKGIRAWRSTHR